MPLEIVCPEVTQKKMGGESMLQAAQKRGWNWVGQMIETTMIDRETCRFRPLEEGWGEGCNNGEEMVYGDV